MADFNNKCPFCGGEAWVDFNPEKSLTWVECKTCHAKSPYARVSGIPSFKTIGEAEAFVIGAWERRSDDE